MGPSSFSTRPCQQNAMSRRLTPCISLHGAGGTIIYAGLVTVYNQVLLQFYSHIKVEDSNILFIFIVEFVNKFRGSNQNEGEDCN